MIAGHSKEYLDSFIQSPVFWESETASKNLYLDDEYFDARQVKSMTSQNSFKTVFANEPLI